jgi:hypothetical protein
MRSFPLIVIACLLCGLPPASAWAQQLQCNPCSHAFGKVQVGNSSSFSIQLSNTGNKTLRITAKSEHGSGFSFGYFPVPVRIKRGASIPLPVIFTPTAQGHAHGTFTLTSNDPNSPLNIQVHGTGVAKANPLLSVSPATLNFGNVTVGSSASLQATLTASNAAVTVTSDQSTNSEFAILGLNLPVTIQSGQSIPVTIQFTPGASGKASGKEEFISNAANSPTVEQVTGTGVAPQPHSVYLSWYPGDGNAVGYNVYRGTVDGGPYGQINTGLDISTNYTDYTVVSGTTYYYVATEVNAQGQESGYSNVGQAVIPSP